MASSCNISSLLASLGSKLASPAEAALKLALTSNVLVSRMASSCNISTLLASPGIRLGSPAEAAQKIALTSNVLVPGWPADATSPHYFPVNWPASRSCSKDCTYLKCVGVQDGQQLQHLLITCKLASPAEAAQKIALFSNVLVSRILNICNITSFLEAK